MKSELQEVCKMKSFIVLIDEQLNESNGYLRSLPLLIRIADGKISRVVVWEPGKNCKKPLNLSEATFEFTSPPSFLPNNTLHCVFANDQQEDAYSYVDKYVESGVPSILVLNHPRFVPKAWRASSKYLESKSPFIPRSFKVELNEYLKDAGLMNFQLPETRNLAFTEVCCLHNALTSEKCPSLTDLLDFDDNRLALSPMWDWAIDLLTLKKENKVANIHAFIFNALRPALEANKHVAQVAKLFENFLEQNKYNVRMIEAKRRVILKTQLENLSNLLNSEKNGSYLKTLLRSRLGRV